MKETYEQLDDREVYEVPNDSNVLINTTMKALEKIRLRGDLSSDNLNYFLVKDPKIARFYLLSKIHKRLHDLPSRTVISNCSFTLRIYIHFWTTICNHLLRGLNPISRTLIIF